MKYLDLTLVVLAAAFIYQIEAQLSMTFHELEINVEETVKFLDDYSGYLHNYGHKNFIDIYSKEYDAIVIGIKTTLFDIQKKIDQASEDGINAEKCYEPAKLALYVANEEVRDELIKCYKITDLDLSTVAVEIRNQIRAAEKIKDDIRKTKEMCQSDSIQEGRCISLHLLKSAASVESLKNNAENIRAKVIHATADEFNDFAICMESHLTAFNDEVQRVVDTAEECIESA